MQLKIKEKVDEAAEMGELNSRAWMQEVVPSTARFRQERAQADNTDGDKSEHKLSRVGERSDFKRWDEHRAERREERRRETRVGWAEEWPEMRLNERQDERWCEHRDRRPGAR